MSEESKNLTASAEPAKEVAVKKTDKPQKKAKKPNVFARIGKWFHELKVEAKKVVWPSGKSVWKNTLVVIVVLVILCAGSGVRRSPRPACPAAGLIPQGRSTCLKRQSGM